MTSQSIDGSSSDLTQVFDERVDFQSAGKARILFALGTRTPCPLETVAELSVNAEVRSTLTSRFDAEVDIGSDGTVRLTEDAQSYVLEGSRSHIKSAKHALDDGKTHAQAGEYEDAIERFRTAVVLLESVQAGFDAVEYTAAELDQALQRAKQHHDTVLTRSTEDSVREHIRRADDALSAGQESSDDTTTASNDTTREAYKALTVAKEAIDSCNRSLLSEDSSPLSVNGLPDRRRKLEQRLAESVTDRESPTAASETASESDTVTDESTETAESTASDSSPTREDLITEIERLTEEMGKVPRSSDMQELGQYDRQQYIDEFDSWTDALESASVDIRSELVADIQAVARKLEKRPSTADMDEHGRYRSQRFYDYFDYWDDAIRAADIEAASRQEFIDELQRVDERCQGLPKTTDMRELGRYDVWTYQSEFGSWDEALEAAGIDKQQRLIDELQRVAETVDGHPNTVDMNEFGEYSGSYVSQEFGSWQAALEAAGISEDSSDDPPTQSDQEQPTPTRLGESAEETSWESIPDNDRLEKQLLVGVTGTRDPHGDRKSVVVEVVDRYGTEFDFDVWVKHDVDTDWTVGEWYALSNTRGTVWEDSDGETCKRLSTTRDLEVEELSASFTPETGSVQDELPSADSTQQDRASTTSSAGVTSGGDSNGSSDTGESDGESGIFEAIKSDFEELE